MNDYFKIPIDVFDDKRLNAVEIGLLSYLFFQSEEKEILELDLATLVSTLKIDLQLVKNILSSLKDYKWLVFTDKKNNRDIEELSLDDKIYYELNIPCKERDPYNQPGSKIARAWTKYFSSRMIKYEDVQELKNFVIDGMEEELVVKVMEYSSEKVKDGRVFYYARAILFDLYKRGVLSIAEYEKENRKGGSSNEQLSKANRGQETRTKRKKFKKEEYR
ncbi:DnaD domain protein [Natronospora cellulosivora (SeqCode)]